MHMLKVENIHKTYGKTRVLAGVSFTMEKGETKVIIGPSGTGKSTLLRCINQLSPPDKGKVWLEGIEVTDKKTNINTIRQKIGFVFQFHHLLPEFTCLENIALPSLLNGGSPKHAYSKALELLERFDMGDKHKRLPEQLSGGEKQRIAIARSLINDPSIILADEPTGNLDHENTRKLLEVFINLKTEQRTVILVTHSLDIETVATCVYNLKEGMLYAM